MELQNKRILITGGQGHIGTNLVERLKGSNEVYVYDNNLFKTGRIQFSGVHYFDALEKLLDIEDADVFFHLGEYSRVEQSVSEPSLVFNNNLNQTIRILDYCQKESCKLIYSASSTKFSDEGRGRYNSPYAFTKYINTEIINNYSKWSELTFAIVYFNNVYGPHELGTGKYATVVEKFICMRKRGISLPVTFPGTQERLFTHVDDLIDALTLITLQGSGDDYVISSDESFSILSLCEMIGGDYVFTPEKQSNRLKSPLLNQKVKSLGWKPKRNLNDYIRGRLSDITS